MQFHFVSRYMQKALTLFFAFCTIVFVQAQTRLDEKLPIDPNVKVGKLANGLTYYIRKNSKPENKVELRLVVNTGSILEDDDQQGLAHFTEHMAFNGSKNFKKNDIVSFLQTIGVEFGADLNAYTSFDETVYILPIPTEKKENVEKGFQILEDWASTITFDANEIEKERGVVLEEERSGKGADDRMQKITLPKIFDGSKYADRLPIGKPEILRSFKPDVIKRFYRDWYRPNLMAVIVVGDIDPTEAEKLVLKHFEQLKNPAKERPRTFVEIPVRKTSEGVVATDPEATNPVLFIYYSNEKVKDDITVGDYRNSMVRRLFTSMLSQRLQELTQKSSPPFLYGGSSLSGFVRGYEGYSAVALLGQGGPEPAINALIEENERARKFGFTAAELDRTKKMVMKSIERFYNERDKTESSSLVEEYIGNFLEKEAIPGVENEFNYHKEFLEGISLDEVNKLAASIIPPVTAGKLVVYTGPDKTDFKTPTNNELVQLVDQATKSEVKAYEEKAIASSIMEKPPVAGKIISEKQNQELGTTELTLGNGVRVLLKPTDFKNDQVVMTSSRFGGQSLYEPKDRLNAEYASQIVAQLGVSQFSPTDIRKVLAGKNAGVSPRIGGISESVSGQASATDLETLLQLTHLYFTQPRKDDDLFRSFISKQQGLYQNMMSDPEYVFQDSLYRILYRNHPWAPRLPKAETFAQLDQNRAIEIYKERFGNANGFTFVIVGAFAIDKIKPLVATYLGSLPSTSQKSMFKDVGLRATKGPLKKEVRKGSEPKSNIRLFWNGEAQYSQEEQIKIQALAELMNIKINETLREELAGMYSGGMYGTMSKYPYGNYSIGVNIPCGPENVDKLITATLAEIEKVRTAGPKEEDLNKVKETWKQQYLVSIKDNNFWARQLLQSVEQGTDPAGILQYTKKVDALKTSDLQDAAKKYLDPGKVVQVVLNPETSAPQR
jgi:zinc protease